MTVFFADDIPVPEDEEPPVEADLPPKTRVSRRLSELLDIKGDLKWRPGRRSSDLYDLKEEGKGSKKDRSSSKSEPLPWERGMIFFPAFSF